MKNIKTLVVVTSLAAFMYVGAFAQEKSLYDRLGGEPAVSAVVDDFAKNVLADDRINKKFAKTNATRLVANLKSFVCFATGGPCKYEGRDMTVAHKHMGTTAGEFNALVEDLVKTLDKFKVQEKEKGELLGALAGLKSQIVEVESNTVGTDLPKKFDPAPPLGEKDKKLEKANKKTDKTKSQ